MEIFCYKQGATQVEEGFTREQLPELLAEPTNVIWVDLKGDTPESVEEAKDVLLNVFKFHKLTVEDCIETRNQPKVEGFPDYFYFIVHGIKPGETNAGNFATKELDGYLGPNYVVTFHVERFKSIREIKEQVRKSPFICERGAAFVLHHILDELIDLYMPVVDDFDRAINDLEDRVLGMKGGTNSLLGEIMDLRRSVARLRRISARQLEVLYRISHGEFVQIPNTVLPFFRDVHDHLVRITDLAENYRDLIGGLFDIHFSVVANKTNDVMKTLAVVSAIILPLSLIAGIYGMNFENMPELHSKNGYYLTIGVMLIITVGLLLYFWHLGWIFAPGDKIVVPEHTQPGSDYEDS